MVKFMKKKTVINKMAHIKEIRNIELWKTGSNPIADFFNHEKIWIDQVDDDMIIFNCNSIDKGTFNNKTNLKKLKSFINWIIENFEFKKDEINIFVDVFLFKLKLENGKWNIETRYF